MNNRGNRLFTGFWGLVHKACIHQYIDLAEEMTENIHFGIYNDPEELYPTAQPVDFDVPLPEELTSDMITDYENTDWSPYYGIYHPYTESEITVKGLELFNSAKALAKDDAEYGRIDKSSVQVDYIRSYFLSGRAKTAAIDVRRMCKSFLEANSELSSNEINELINNIAAYVREPLMTEYIAYNRALADKMLLYGVNYIRESHYIKYDTADFAKIPEDWDD